MEEEETPELSPLEDQLNFNYNFDDYPDIYYPYIIKGQKKWIPKPKLNDISADSFHLISTLMSKDEWMMAAYVLVRSALPTRTDLAMMPAGSFLLFVQGWTEGTYLDLWSQYDFANEV